LAVQEILKLLSGVDADASGKPHIAVVPLSGSITMGSGEALFESDGISERGASRTIQRLIEDDAVRAVVLRIDSPGGSALASDLIWSRLRELGRTKPLIASVGGMAASGGYYLACAADRIVAESTSIVGSIGVVGGKIVFGPALEPLGIHTVTLTPGPDANRVAYESPLVAWDDGTRERVREQMLQVYELFVDRVTEGRNIQRERVLEAAEGRVFSGRQGLERGLVDALGGLTDALDWARKEAGLDAQAPVTVEGQGDGLLATLGLDAEASAEQFAASVERRQKRLYGPLAAVPKEWLPWVVGLSPLLEQERVLTLLPVVLQVP
jgi:protease-4